MAYKEINKKIREASGNFDYNENDKILVAFLYDLMRDHLPSGTVVSLINSALECKDDEIRFANGWLASQAVCFADLLNTKGERNES